MSYPLAVGWSRSITTQRSEKRSLRSRNGLIVHFIPYWRARLIQRPIRHGWAFLWHQVPVPIHRMNYSNQIGRHGIHLPLFPPRKELFLGIRMIGISLEESESELLLLGHWILIWLPEVTWSGDRLCRLQLLPCFIRSLFLCWNYHQSGILHPILSQQLVLPE